ncbi:MAG: ribosome silencing factor [Pseudorhodoferax sp.]
MTTGPTSESAAKKDTQKLQRSIIDGLEDVKAQDIQVFNTEHLSPLFERVIVASGTSNRQTRALAASVRDAVREAGFAKPRVEGEDNGEWIIVDCGPAVVHIMQPSIRQYYHLEELWGDKPVRLKLGAPKPAAPAKAVEKVPAKKVAAKKTASGKKAKPEPEYAPERPVIAAPARKKAPAKKAAAPAKTAAPAKKAAAKKTPVKTPVKTVVVGKPAAKKAAPAKKAAARRA